MTKCEQDYYTRVPQQLKKMAELLEKIYDEITQYDKEQ